MLVKAQALNPWICLFVVVTGCAVMTSSEEIQNGAQDYPPYGWCSH